MLCIPVELEARSRGWIGFKLAGMCSWYSSPLSMGMFERPRNNFLWKFFDGLKELDPL